jgi:Ca-activated chloride channel family protein
MCYRVFILAVLLVGSAVAGAAQDGAEGDGDGLGVELGMGDVAGPSLLVATGMAGRYRLAPVQATEVTISVRGVLAEAVVVQRFTNPTDGWLEGVYVFPLPTEAAVHALRLEIGERVIEGRVAERAEAARVYAAAKAEGKKASLVEQERPNIFTTSVANIGPGETVAVLIEYQQMLRFADDGLELRFPLVVGPRFTPGAPLARAASGTGWAFDSDEVPDASRVTPPVVLPGAPPVNPVRLSVRLEPGFPLARLASPYHAVEITRPTADAYQVELAATPADRDFVLVWAPERGSEPRAAVFTEERDGAYYVLALVVPPAADQAAAVRLPRETVFVVDTSGSMGGASIAQAKDALLAALAQLHADDYFNIIEFDNDYSMLFTSSRQAFPATVAEGRAWVERLSANGGTQMMAPLVKALEDPAELTAVRQVVFITDGCVGNEDALFAAVERGLGRSRLFTVGIGSAPNSHFMERAAGFGRGSFTSIGAPGEVGPKMGELFRKLENPVLADLELVWPDADAEVWPARVPDLYAGEPLVVAARLGTVAGDLGVAGVRAAERWQARIPLAVGVARAGVDRLWARRKIDALMDGLARGVAEPEVRAAVLEVALAHSLVSRYTSLVAVDLTPSRPAGEGLATGAVPTNLPAGWQYEKVFGTLPRGGTASRLHLLLGVVLLAAAGLIGLLGRRS